MTDAPAKRTWTRRAFLGAAAVAVPVAFLLRKKILGRIARYTERPEFSATPPLVPHDPARDARTLYVARGGGPTANVDSVLDKLGGLEKIVGPTDVVIVKVSAQWWNQGMTNVAAVKRLVERVLATPGFKGEVIVFENTHFVDKSGGGLTRAFTHPSERNVDVPGWNKLGDLIPHFEKLGAPVSFVGLIDAGKSTLAGDHWHDAAHEHGVYGGDGRGPIEPGDARDGYHWDETLVFKKKRSLVDYAETPLTWPRFTSPRTGVVVDLKEGLFRREGGRLVAIGDRKLTWISMVTANEHESTGMTCACKSAMGIVDMSAGRMGSHPRAARYSSVHYFGAPSANWRMAGPLAHFATHVRAPDLYLAVAEWVAIHPESEAWDDERADIRMAASSARHVGAVVAGVDPVAIDTFVAKNLLMPLGGARKKMYDVDDPDSTLSRFLRYYREVRGQGTLDLGLIHAA